MQYAPAEPIYHQYNGMVAFYDEVRTQYNSLENPNDGLVKFLEELETKMVEGSVITQFSSQKDRVVMNMQAPDYEAAAKMIEKLRGFDSLNAVAVASINEVKVDAIEESEDREAQEARTYVEFEIVCFYQTVVAVEE